MLAVRQKEEFECLTAYVVNFMGRFNSSPMSFNALFALDISHVFYPFLLC